MGDARIRKKLEDAVRAGANRDYREAVKLLEDVLARSDDYPEALLYLGRARHVLGEYGRAIVAFTDYLRIRPRSALGRVFLGRSYLSAFMPRKAIFFLEEAAALKPNDADVAAMLGMAYLKARRSAKAVEHFERAVGLAPQNPRIYRAYVNALLVRGIRLARSGDANLASQTLQFAVANGADSVLPRLELGRLYSEAGDWRSALAQYDRAIDFSPDDPQLRWYRASALMALNDDAAARAELEAIRSLGASIPEIAWNAELVDRFMIRSFLSAGQWRKAAAACSSYLKKLGSEASIHAMYAEALRGLGEFGTAENHARRAISLAPKELGLHYELLLVLWEKDDWKGLKAELQTAARMGCDDEILLRFTALLASKTNADDKAVIDLVQNAIRRTGPAPELMFALASRYLRIGLADLAEPWYRKTLAIEASSEEAALGLIAALDQLVKERSAGAEERLTEAYSSYLASYPSNRSMTREYALHLIRRQLFEEAIPQLEALTAWESENWTLRKLLAYAYRKTARYKDAVVILKALLKEHPKESALLMELAHCLDKAGASTYAIDLLKKASGAFPKNAAVVLALGILLAKEGKKEAALDAFREASARAPKDPRPLRRMEAAYRKSGVREFADRYAAMAAKLEAAAR